MSATPANPLVSILTPSYNTARHLGAAVRSVLSQDYPNIEYVVMDGSSTDGSVDVLKSFGPRLRWISQKDGGQTDALIKGFHQTKGAILGWLNSDDTYAPGAVKAAVEYLWAHPEVAVVYGDAHFIDARGEVIGPCQHVEPFNAHRLFHYSDFIVQPAAFFRRSAFESVGGLDHSLHWCMDYDLWLKFAKKGYQFAHLNKHLANYRWLANAKTASGAWLRLRELEKVVARYSDGTHGYLRLEMINQHLQDASKQLRGLRLVGGTTSLFKAAGKFFTSARAMRSALQPRTWRIIHTGQVLRKRALAE